MTSLKKAESLRLLLSNSNLRFLPHGTRVDLNTHTFRWVGGGGLAIRQRTFGLGESSLAIPINAVPRVCAVAWRGVGRRSEVSQYLRTDHHKHQKSHPNSGMRRGPYRVLQILQAEPQSFAFLVFVLANASLKTCTKNTVSYPYDSCLHALAPKTLPSRESPHSSCTGAAMRFICRSAMRHKCCLYKLHAMHLLFSYNNRS